MLIAGIIILLIILVLMLLVYFHMKKQNITGKMNETFLKTISITTIFSIFILSAILLLMPLNKVMAQGQPSQTQASAEVSKASNQSQLGFGLLAAGLAVGIGCLGAGIAVGMAGAAAVGAISENPKVFGSALVFVVLGEGIAIYGIVIAILILSRV